MTNLPIDENGYPGGDDGVDFQMIDGRTVQVKTSKIGKLIFNKDDFDRHFCTDIAVLVLYKTREGSDRKIHNVVRAQGWILKTEFIRKRKEIDFGFGPRWVVDADRLNSFDTLIY